MEHMIRRAERADLESLWALDTVVPDDRGRVEQIAGWLERDVMLVAEAEARVVGYGVYSRFFFHQGSVEMLMIHPGFRRRRVGDSLLASLEGLCDTPRLWVTTNLSNVPMQRLLNGRGYRACGFIDGLDPGDPELVFAKDVSSQSSLGTESGDGGPGKR